MPELPEVETTRRGLDGLLRGRRFTRARVRDARLRWPVPADLDARIAGRRVSAVRRRAKYLLIELDRGWLLLHLGMSGSLRVIDAATPPEVHDHVDLVLDNGQALRLRDPRRFGSLHWIDAHPERHPLLARLGVEPLSETFDADHLRARLAGRRIAIKQALMDSHVVVGVGNIYASEALFRAGIRPTLAAGKVSRPRLERLVAAIRATLEAALAAGGTTLRDFRDSAGQPGYFQLETRVYGRAGEPCRVCGTAIRQTRQGQRSTFFCPRCQAH
jgi:formamidopyrimidine-DNA glycosylase